MTKKIALKVFFIILITLIIQTVSFLTIGPRMLFNKLLDNNCFGNNINSDSVFVRDYYTTDCNVGDFYTYEHSLNLEDNSEQLRKKLNAKFIHFASKKNTNWLEEPSNKYYFEYQVNAKSPNGFYLFGFYECKLDEYIYYNNLKRIKFKQTHYRWFLFFWIKTDEYCDGWEN
jgi:hypothetical protein